MFVGNFENHTIDDVAELMMDGLLYHGAWEEHVASWWAHRKQPNVLLVKYEDMKKDLQREVQRIPSFLGTELTQERFQTVMKVSSLAYMKQRSDKIQGREWAEQITGRAVKEDYALVDGSGHKDAFSPHIIERLRKHFQDKAAPLLGNPGSYADIELQ
eukprot:TRINITY_DN12193_c0_g1_i2.p2 TRINITY_DN12193_c0_g1~~TRINITY_DN12193_c0_g1_i2.p2  ORF type:complete len:158 (+),score=28.98 TRINITY_DN12193_c0_g1_i2:612-1085(+)